MMDEKVFRELVRLAERTRQIVNSDAAWCTKYDSLFCKDVSRRVHALDPDFDYYDPDTGYEDDVRAFVVALEERVAKLQPVFEALTALSPSPPDDAFESPLFTARVQDLDDLGWRGIGRDLADKANRIGWSPAMRREIATLRAVLADIADDIEAGRYTSE